MEQGSLPLFDLKTRKGTIVALVLSLCSALSFALPVILWNKGDKTKKKIKGIKHATQITPTKFQTVEVADDRKNGIFLLLTQNKIIPNSSSLVPTAQRAP